MQIINLRLGHATNSSSTHSIVITGEKLKDKWADDDYGWDFFTCASREAKERYFASSLFHRLQDSGEELAKVTLKGMGLPTDVGHVDHQSRLSFPLNYKGSGINLDYAKDLLEFLRRDNVAVLGGNDNDDEGHPALSHSTSIFTPHDGWVNAIARKDGDVWTLYTKGGGNRVSFVFGEGGVASFKPTTPFLVDLKITDYCEAGCEFCYQNSTRDGKHAKNVNSYLYRMGDAGVFEVAIGGGEPTTHPDFLNILETARWCGITPNFSTKSLKVDDKAIELCGAFAYSVTSGYDAIKAVQKYADTKKLVFQIVPGVISSRVLEELLIIAANACIPVTLLGYKQVGRAKKPSTTEEGWLDVVKMVKENHWMELGIDTTLAARYMDKLAEFDERTFHVEEGKYSMYIDAVTGMCGPSSYQKDKLFEIGDKTVEECFQQIQQTKGDIL
jgi:organic radical activating enzyme